TVPAAEATAPRLPGQVGSWLCAPSELPRLQAQGRQQISGAGHGSSRAPAAGSLPRAAPVKQTGENKRGKNKQTRENKAPASCPSHLPPPESTMAAAEPLQNIKAEVTCPICQELFLDPVTSECGHSFCRECIAQHCQGDRDIACPLCNEKLRKGNLRPNRELKNIVELVKSQAVEDPRGGYVCKMHREPLRFYCKEDETPVCMACERSRAHRAHTVVPVEEAVQEHKKQTLRKYEDATSPPSVDPARSRKDGASSGGNVAALTELPKEKAIAWEASVGKLHWRLLGLGLTSGCGSRKGQCSGAERRGQMSEEQKQASICVHTDGDTPVVRRRKVSLPASEEHEPVADNKTGISCQVCLKETGFEKCITETLSTDFQERLSEITGPELTPAEATLDSDTAYPQLVLSKDRKSVRLGDTLQDLPDNPGRFCSSFAVLGSEGFTSGRHYWEVEVGAGGGWGIGVSKGYVKRKSRSSFNAKKGIWALTSSHPPPSFCETPQLIGVFLDYAGGKVTFFDAENMIPLLTHSAKFTGKIFPFFRL
uniref:Tripartite motif containing 39 n=1 Tax=Pelodiscus sinensis TaxID=13735 RepID=K7FUA4_PELSI